jgi:hypothetical protein
MAQSTVPYAYCHLRRDDDLSPPPCGRAIAFALFSLSPRKCGESGLPRRQTRLPCPLRGGGREPGLSPVVAGCLTPMRGVACVVGQPPAAVAPWRPGVAMGADIGDRIEAVRSPRMAAADACQCQPAPAPGAVELDRLQPILRARRQVPAFPADQGLQGPAIGMNWRTGDLAQCARGGGRWPTAVIRPQAPAGAGSACFASACSSARSTASNTRSVEAWRAL